MVGGTGLRRVVRLPRVIRRGSWMYLTGVARGGGSVAIGACGPQRAPIEIVIVSLPP